tara:strand:- start:4338 stop:5579 length:1242 start_codon:yes stop_codon:yes gene_type:complete
MKLLVVGLNYAPDTIGIAKYTSEMCEWMASRGHEIHVVTTPPYYPAWSIPETHSGYVYRSEILRGVNVLRTPLYVPRNLSSVKRLLHLISFSLFSFPATLWKGLSFRPDMILTIAPAVFSAPGSRVVAALCGAKSWLHIQDFEVDAAFGLGMLKGTKVRNLALFFEKWLLRSFSKVSTISPQMIALLRQKGCAESRMYEFRNWVDLSKINPEAELLIDTAKNPFREMIGVEKEQILVLYAGNIAYKQGIEIIPAAAQLLRHRDDVKFLIVGDGQGKEKLVNDASGMTNVYFLPLQPAAMLNSLLCAADIHLLPQRSGAADLVLPSKLTGMFASGRPVIATALPGTGLGSEVEKRGLIVPPGDPAALALAITILADNASLRAKLGAAARARSVEAFGLDSILGAIESEFSKLVA